MKHQTFDDARPAGIAETAFGPMPTPDCADGGEQAKTSPSVYREPPTGEEQQTRDEIGRSPNYKVMAQAMREMAEQLDGSAADPEPCQGHVKFATLAAAVHGERLRRMRFFPPDLLGEPAWDLLLDLFVALHGNKLRSVKEGCLAANVPEATAMRYIDALVGQGLIVRRRDKLDARRKFLCLTDEGNRRMLEYFCSIPLQSYNLGSSPQKWPADH